MEFGVWDLEFRVQFLLLIVKAMAAILCFVHDFASFIFSVMAAVVCLLKLSL